MQICVLIYALVLALFWSPGAAAAPADDKKYTADVEAKLRRQLDTFAQEGYQRQQIASDDSTALVERGKSKSIPLQLQAAMSYIIVVACDSDCTHVAIALRDSHGQVLAKSADRENTAIIKGMPSDTARHSISIEVPGCNEDECYVGLMLLRQGVQTEEKRTIPSVAGALITGSITAAFRNFDNYDLVGGDLEKFRDTNLEACASACTGNPACVAYSFDKWNRWCFLKGAAGVFRLEPNTVTAVRTTVGEPALSSAPVTMQRYRNKAFLYGGQDTRRAETFDECEGRCGQDTACVAFTFFKTSNQCRLMHSTGEYFPDAKADSGVKRQEPN